MEINKNAFKKTVRQLKYVKPEIDKPEEFVREILNKFSNVKYRIKFRQVISRIDTEGIGLKNGFTYSVFRRMGFLISVYEFYSDHLPERTERRKTINWLLKNAKGLIGSMTPNSKTTIKL